MVDPAAPSATRSEALDYPQQVGGFEPYALNSCTIVARLEKIFKWTTALTTEQAESPDYVETRESLILKNRLTRLRGQLIAVLGMQGIGKTALRQHLAEELDNTLSLKWSGARDFARILTEATDYDEFLAPDGYAAALIKAVNRRLGYVALSSETHYISKLIKEGFNIDTQLMGVIYRWSQGQAANNLSLKAGDAFIPQAEAYLSSRDLARVQDTYARAAVHQLDTILIDFPDYDRRTRAQALRDLNEFQLLWEKMNFTPGAGYNPDDETPNLVLFWQAEAWQADHFFQGKFTVLRLRVLTAAELTNLYINKFGDPWPFTEEALEALATLSRGIPRWYKKYIGLCLDEYLIENPELVTPHYIAEWITIDQLAEDMNRELMNIFPRSKKHRQRTAIVQLFLQEHGPTAQMDLTQRFFGPDEAAESESSRFFSKLEEGGYVIRLFEGRQAFIRLPDDAHPGGVN